MPLSTISKFMLIDHELLLVGTAFCNGSHICYIAISSSCTVAVIKSHASLCQLYFHTFRSEAMFQRALLLILQMTLQEEEVAVWHSEAKLILSGKTDNCTYFMGLF